MKRKALMLVVATAALVLAASAAAFRLDVIRGTHGPDTLNGTPGNDLIYARGGNDIVHAHDGNDVVYAGQGNDVVRGGHGNDVLYAGPGDDVMRPGAGVACNPLAVTKDPSPFKQYVTSQKAVNAAKPCDWILVAPGIYRESVTITKDHIHLRGLNRNTVIVDGGHAKGVNGIVVDKANDVWIENLTVRNFDRAERDGEDGNQIWWNGGDESGQIGAQGWRGDYMAAFDDWLLGSK